MGYSRVRAWGLPGHDQRCQILPLFECIRVDGLDLVESLLLFLYFICCSALNGYKVYVKAMGTRYWTWHQEKMHLILLVCAATLQQVPGQNITGPPSIAFF